MVLWLAFNHEHSLFAQSIHSMENWVLDFINLDAAIFYFAKEVIQGDVSPGAANTS